MKGDSVEIKAGTELDRAVAEAVGLVATHKVLGGGYFFSDPRDGTGAAPIEIYPSMDLNAAFYAAEKIGLFDTERDGPEVHLAKTIDGRWEILTGGTEMGYVSREDSPALAICAAILAVTKDKASHEEDASSKAIEAAREMLRLATISGSKYFIDCLYVSPEAQKLRLALVKLEDCLREC